MCGTSSRFVQVTVEPVFTVTVAGLNSRFLIVTETADPAGTGGAVTEGTPEGETTGTGVMIVVGTRAGVPMAIVETGPVVTGGDTGVPGAGDDAHPARKTAETTRTTERKAGNALRKRVIACTG